MIKKRNLTLILLDIVIINLSYIIGLLLRFEGTIPEIYLNLYLNYALAVSLIHLAVYYFFRLYRIMWRFASIFDFMRVLEGVFFSNILAAGFLMLVDSHLPRSIYAIAMILTALGSTGIRALSRLGRSRFRLNSGPKNINRVLIIGAGEAGVLVAKEYIRHEELQACPVAFIDDDLSKQGKSILKIPVVGTRKDIIKTVHEYDIDEIIMALPSAKKEDRADIAEIAAITKKPLKIVPGVYEFIDGKINVRDIRDIDISDLLGRDEVHLDRGMLNEFLKGKRILVTGAGGTIGSELCRQILKFEPRQLILVDIYENTTYEIQNEILRHQPQAPIKVLIDSIRDAERIDQIFNHYQPEVVFHAAAHKHVPLMETSYISAVKNNVFGTLNVMKAAEKHGVEKFVNISTDKAVNPTSVMGCTKRVVEIMLQCIDRESNTDFVAVRFGNVLGSHGSVIPLFREQIKEGGPVTVTHKEIIRYFMTIPEACQLVLQAGAIARGGEIFVLDMGDPVKIDDLARKMIELSGLKPDVDIEIKYTGLRPGEKLYEELLIDDEQTTTTDYDMIFVEKPKTHDEEKLWENLEELKAATHQESKEAIIDALKVIVPNFTPDLKE